MGTRETAIAHTGLSEQGLVNFHWQNIGLSSNEEQRA